MSYCVNCGVELDKTARFCPLCHTEVCNPRQPVDTESPSPFPLRRQEVEPVSRKELALLLSSMLLSVAVCCGLLNLFLLPGLPWSLYVIGGAAMLWFWLVPHLLFRRIPVWLRLCVGTLAIGGYVGLIAFLLDGWHWYWGLALPVVLLLGALQLAVLALLDWKRSILTNTTCLIGLAGLFLLGLDCLITRWLTGRFGLSWSIAVAAVCAALMIPLLVIRHRPSLRDEVRRRFHL